MTGGSLWLESTAPSFARLDEDLDADVAVIGGGIVGVTAALALHEAGARVVLLEGGRIGHGTSGHTTAKVSSQHGFKYAALSASLGIEAARRYAGANEAALGWIAGRVREHGIDCDFRRRASYAYVTDAARRDAAAAEASAAQAAGLPATLVEEAPLPYPVAAAVRFDEQAELHPYRYLLGLLARLPADRIYEHTHAIHVAGSGPSAIVTPGGRVHAEHVIVATQIPFLDRSLAFARVHPQRSYAIACRIGGAAPDAMHLSADEPTRSVRAVPVDGEELLLVGGEGHRTGEGGDTERRYMRLEAFAREHWDVRSVDYRWSAQDYVSADGLPLVGRVTPWRPRVLMATGFGKWGMTNGTAAALLLADLVRGRPNPFARLLDPRRLHLRAAARDLIVENARSGARLVGDALPSTDERSVDDLAAGEGGIVELDGERVAASRDADGALVAVSARCTHLGCQVVWNGAERSWDCPCHGSRFAADGAVLQGPAVHRLERKPV